MLECQHNIPSQKTYNNSSYTLHHHQFQVKRGFFLTNSFEFVEIIQGG
jgi:hypothetical protein